MNGIKASIVWYLSLLLFGCSGYSTPFFDGSIPTDEGSTAEFIALTGTPYTALEQIALFSSADIILIGMLYSSADSKIAGHTFIQTLLRNKRNIAIMFADMPRTMQPILNQYASGRVRGEDVISMLSAKGTVGYPYVAYEPILKVAHAMAIPLYAGGIPPYDISYYMQHGSVLNTAYIPKIYIPYTQKELEMLHGVFFNQIHNKNMPAQKKNTYERYLMASSLMDNAIAELSIIVKNGTAKQLVIIIGANRIKCGGRVARMIAERVTNARIMSIMPYTNTCETQPFPTIYYRVHQ